MPRRPKISPAVRRQVMELDAGRCAYCRSPMIIGIPMVVEHCIPLVAGGLSTIGNLCLSCYRCNEFKGPRTEGPDPSDGMLVPLFHPRRQRWQEHFVWSEDGSRLVALTACGRSGQSCAWSTVERSCVAQRR
jgi:hypothetical protein